MFGIPMEIVTMILSTVGSAYIRMQADSRQDLAVERQYRAGAMEAVRAFTSPPVNMMRRFITIAFLGMAYILLLAPLLDMPTVVPVEITEGFKILFFDFTSTRIDYITLEGMVTPQYLPHAIMAVVGFYFGNSMAKRG